MKKHPHKNLGGYLHPKKANPLAVKTKPHTAPVHQTKTATPKIPVAPKMVKGRGRG